MPFKKEMILHNCRKGWLYGGDKLYAPISSNTNTDSGQSSTGSRSVSEGQNIILHPDNPTQDYGRMTRFSEDIQHASPFSVIVCEIISLCLFTAFTFVE